MRAAISILLAVVAFSSCRNGSNIGEGVLLQIKLNESVVMPTGSEFILENNFTKTNSLSILESSTRLTQVSAGRTFTLTVDYETTTGFTHIGFRIGYSGEFWLVPVTGVGNSKSGLVSYQIQMPEDVCLDFSPVCSSIEITEFIANKNSDGGYLISNMISFDLTMVCGDCDEPTCRGFQTTCVTSEEQCNVLSTNLQDYKEFYERAISVGDTIGYCSFVTRYIATLKGREYQSCIENNLALYTVAEYPAVLDAIEIDRLIICKK